MFNFCLVPKILIIFFHYFLVALKAQLRETQRAAFASGTYKNLLVQWEKYLQFCASHGILPMPASVDNLCLYAQFLANNMKAPQTVKNYINGVRVFHLLNDKPLDVFSSADLKLTMRGIFRLKMHQPRQAQPLTLDLLLAMSRFVDKSHPKQLVMWTAILLAFFCLLRKSNYLVDSGKPFDSGRQLCRRDVVLGQGCILVNIKWSKAIQFGNKILQIPILAIPNSVLCPVDNYSAMLTAVPARPEDPAFCVGRQASRSPISYTDFQVFLKRLVALAGWDPSVFSSHSLRRGGASLAFRAKVPGELIQVQGDWASDAYLRYLSIPLDQRIQVAGQVRDLVCEHQGNLG